MKKADKIKKIYIRWIRRWYTVGRKQKDRAYGYISYFP